jgi:hypothetical protein
VSEKPLIIDVSQAPYFEDERKDFIDGKQWNVLQPQPVESDTPRSVTPARLGATSAVEFFRQPEVRLSFLFIHVAFVGLGNAALI